MEELLHRTHAVGNLLGSVGTGALEVLPEPVPAEVTRMLVALQRFLDQVPPVVSELEVLVEEVHAKPLTVQALQAELAAFEHQLEVLERSLAPLDGWAHQVTWMRASLAEMLRSAVPEGEV